MSRRKSEDYTGAHTPSVILNQGIATSPRPTTAPLRRPSVIVTNQRELNTSPVSLTPPPSAEAFSSRSIFSPPASPSSYSYSSSLASKRKRSSSSSPSQSPRSQRARFSPQVASTKILPQVPYFSDTPDAAPSPLQSRSQSFPTSSSQAMQRSQTTIERPSETPSEKMAKEQKETRESETAEINLCNVPEHAQLDNNLLLNDVQNSDLLVPLPTYSSATPGQKTPNFIFTPPITDLLGNVYLIPFAGQKEGNFLSAFPVEQINPRITQTVGEEWVLTEPLVRLLMTSIDAKYSKQSIVDTKDELLTMGTTLEFAQYGETRLVNIIDGCLSIPNVADTSGMDDFINGREQRDRTRQELYRYMSGPFRRTMENLVWMDERYWTEAQLLDILDKPENKVFDIAMVEAARSKMKHTNPNYFYSQPSLAVFLTPLRRVTMILATFIRQNAHLIKSDKRVILDGILKSCNTRPEMGNFNLREQNWGHAFISKLLLSSIVQPTRIAERRYVHLRYQQVLISSDAGSVKRMKERMARDSIHTSSASIENTSDLSSLSSLSIPDEPVIPTLAPDMSLSRPSSVPVAFTATSSNRPKLSAPVPSKSAFVPFLPAFGGLKPLTTTSSASNKAASTSPILGPSSSALSLQGWGLEPEVESDSEEENRINLENARRVREIDDAYLARLESDKLKQAYSNSLDIVDMTGQGEQARDRSIANSANSRKRGRSIESKVAQDPTLAKRQQQQQQPRLEQQGSDDGKETQRPVGIDTVARQYNTATSFASKTSDDRVKVFKTTQQAISDGYTVNDQGIDPASRITFSIQRSYRVNPRESLFVEPTINKAALFQAYFMYKANLQSGMPYAPLVFYKTKMSIVRADTLNRAVEMINAPHSLHPLVMDMAHPSLLGGRPEQGATAQEEQLCFRTTLYPVLKHFYNQVDAKAKEASHNAAYPPRPRLEWDHYIPDTTGLYLSDIWILRDDQDGGYKFRSKSQIKTVDIYATAALRHRSRNPNRRFKGDGPLVEEDLNSAYKDKATYNATMREKIESMFKHAFIHHKDSLLLGAFGTGIFGNPDDQVIADFQYVLNKWVVDGKSVFKRIDWAIFDRDQTKLDKWSRAFNNARPEDSNYSAGASEIKIPDAEIKAAANRMGYLAPLLKTLVIDDDDDDDDDKEAKDKESEESEKGQEEESNLLGPIVNNKNFDTDTKIRLLQEQDDRLRAEQNETLNSRGKLGSKQRLHSIQDKRREIQESLSVLRQSQFGQGESYSGRARAEKRLAVLNVKIDEKTSQSELDKTLLAIVNLQKTSTDPILTRKYNQVLTESRRREKVKAKTKEKSTQAQDNPSVKTKTKTSGNTGTRPTSNIGNASKPTQQGSEERHAPLQVSKGQNVPLQGGEGTARPPETLEPYDLVIRRKRLAKLYWRASFDAHGYDKAGNPLGARLGIISDMLEDVCVIVGEPDPSVVFSADEKTFRGPSAGYKAMQRFSPDQAHALYAMGLSDIFNQVAEEQRQLQIQRQRQAQAHSVYTDIGATRSDDGLPTNAALKARLTVRFGELSVAELTKFTPTIVIASLQKELDIDLGPRKKFIKQTLHKIADEAIAREAEAKIAGPFNFLQQLISGDTTKYPQFARKIVLVPMWVGGSHYQHILIDGRPGKKRAYFWDPMNRLSPFIEDANKTYGYYTYVSWWKQHMLPLNWTLDIIDWQTQVDDKYNCAIYGLYFLAHYVELDTYTIYADPKKPFERKERFLFDLGEGKTDDLIKRYATEKVNKQRNLFASLSESKRLEEKKRIQDADSQQYNVGFTDAEYSEIQKAAAELANERGVASAEYGGEDAIIERDAIVREVTLERARAKQDKRSSETKKLPRVSPPSSNLPSIFQRVPGLLVANNNATEASNYYDLFNQYVYSQLGIVRTHGSVHGDARADKNYNLIVALRSATE